MSAKEFFDLVVEYRRAEYRYAEEKSENALMTVVDRRRQIDAEIKRVLNILNGKK